MTRPFELNVDFDETIEWLTQRGFPTFEEFKKNPDKWRPRSEEILESADRSSISYRARLGKQSYMWKDQIECKTLEQLQRICKEEGYDPLNLEMRPILKPRGGTGKDRRTDLVIQFWPKHLLRLMGGIIAND